VERTPTEDVNVYVKNRLARAFTRVDHTPIPTLSDALMARNLTSHVKQMAKRSLIVPSHLAQGGNVLSRDNKYMRGGLRIDVTKGNRLIVAVNDCGGNFAFDDSTEETICFRHYKLSLAQ
jgi:hypothetical protein